MCVCLSGYLPIVEYLLEHGADVEARAVNGTTPLRAAAFEGHVLVVRKLIQKQAEVRLKHYQKFSISIIIVLTLDVLLFKQSV